MIPVFFAEQMRQCDRFMTEKRGIPSVELMRRAGEALARQVAEECPEHGRVLVVCGGGNNGGDGYCLAELLHQTGCRAEIVALAEKLSPDAAHYAAHCRERGVPLVGLEADFSGYGLIVDAIFGTGLTRNIEGVFAKAVAKINASGVPVLAADIPSGLNGDTGEVMGCAVRADGTVTFAGYKYGQLLGDGRDLCGRLTVADIGIENVIADCGFVTDGADAKRAFPKRAVNTHKGTYGRVALFAGSRDYFGAASLSESALSALNTGAGYCYLACPGSLSDLYRLKNPEVIVRELPELDGKILYSERDADELRDKTDCAAIGMGLGATRDVYDTVCRLLSGEKPVLIDADGLNALAAFGVSALKSAAAEVVLTPHVKEFERLCAGEELPKHPVLGARAFAAKYGVTLALKSATTIITDGKRVALNIAGSPALAKGGSGDVLSGVIAAMLARKLPPFEAALAGCYVFGKSGELAAAELGEYSPLASDVVNCLPQAIENLC